MPVMEIIPPSGPVSFERSFWRWREKGYGYVYKNGSLFRATDGEKIGIGPGYLRWAQKFARVKVVLG